ncbi:porin [Undibacterium arcticum]|uniref:Porin n=1 Tax=Undibacterium arcticum TaxID=1762892 RepID=A0ABV7F086_9BURK
MKKQILATLALAALAGTAAAQSKVTMYGLADLGLDRQSGGTAGSVTKVSSGIQNGSRLGFKGTEDLGGGVSALFVLEMGIAMDTGNSNQSGRPFGRQAYTGLKGDFGAVTLGRQYTAIDGALCGGTDPFGCGLAGTAGNLFSDGGTPTNDGNGSRTNNAIKYTAPVTAGFNAEATYAPGEVAGNNTAGRTMGGAIGYGNGPFNIKLAHNNVANATDTSRAKVTFLGGKYDFGPVALSLGLALNRDAFSSNTNIANPDSRDVLAGVTVPCGAGTLLASFIKKTDKSGAGNDARQLAVGYLYALSRRTNLYSSYARINNTVQNTQAAKFYTVGNAIDGGSGNSAFNFGMRHTF